MNNILEEINEELELMTYNSAFHTSNVFNEEMVDFEAGNNGWYRIRAHHVAENTYDIWVEKFEWRFSKTPCHGRVFIGVSDAQVFGIVEELFH